MHPHDVFPQPPNDLNDVKSWVDDILPIVLIYKTSTKITKKGFSMFQKKSEKSKNIFYLICGALAFIGAALTLPAYLTQVVHNFSFNTFFIFHVVLHFIAIIAAACLVGIALKNLFNKK